ncbi:MAG: class I SAM-dependent methyltransferase [Defluviitaleaceae bacterium]|nr:class I SAM-dependent methyltransferase [Defluviitaleaceae bacterium]
MNRKLSKRLSACLDALSSHSRIADIGTDHAYLPCYGIVAGIIKSAIAIDVIDGPLEQAKSTIDHYELAGRVELRKGSGLEPLKIGEVEGVVMAGMGGRLISQLLLKSLPIAQSMKTLVFQPQGGEAILRRMLVENNFVIIHEQLLEEDGLIYTVITAKPDEMMTYTALDITFGPILRQHVQDPLFIKKWEQEMAAIDRVVREIPAGNERKQAFQEQQQRIKDVLAGVIN